MVTLILRWNDLETLKDVVNVIKAVGGFVNESCGLHVHIGADGFTAKSSFLPPDARGFFKIIGLIGEEFKTTRHHLLKNLKETDIRRAVV